MNATAELIFAMLVRGAWLMTGALAVVFLLRRRAPLVASALLRGTIVALLIMPALIAAMPSVVVPLLSAVSPPTHVGTLPRDKMPVSPVETPSVSLPVDSAEPAMDVESVTPIASTPIVGSELPQPTAAATARQSRPIPWTSLLLGIYLAGVTFFASRMLIGLWLVRRLRVGVGVADPGWQQSLRECSERLGVACDVQLTSSSSVSVPMTIGWRRPVILLPESSLASSPIDREALLLHELAHIRRHDYFWLVLLRLVEIVYWCHPLLWLMGRADRQLREQACDDVCIHWLGSGERYRDALLGIASRITSRPRLAVGLAMASTLTLSRRVAHILQSTGSARCVTARSSRMTIAGLLLILAPTMAVVQLVPRTGQALAADDQLADDTRPEGNQPTTPTADAEEPGAFSSTFRVTSADGSAIDQGKARVHGYTRSGSYFEEELEINEGSVDVPVPSSHLERLTLVMSAPDHLSHYKAFERIPGEPGYVVLPEYEFTLQRGYLVGGRLVNEAGEPIAGATLYLHGGFGNDYEQGFDAFEEMVTTDADGRWKSTQAADPANLHMYAEHDQYLARGETIGRTEADAERLRSFNDVRTLTAAPTLSGTVVDPDGRPVAGAMMLLNNSDLFNPPDEQIPVTDQDGRFHFANIRQGEHEMTVFSPDWAMETVTVKVPSAEPVRITVHKGSRVEFRAVNTEGELIEGMHFRPDGIYVYDFLLERGLLNNTTNAGGIVIWENAPHEPLSYQIIQSGYVSIRRQKFGPEGSPHTLVFDHAIPVDLTVVDAATGEVLTDYKLYEGHHFKTNSPEYWGWNFLRPRSLRHENSGWAERNGADANEPALALTDTGSVVQYRVQAEGYRPGVTDILDAAELIGTTVQAEIRLKRNAEYAGRVLRPDGTPAADANVYLFTQLDGEEKTIEIANGIPDAAEAMLAVECEADGRFRLPPQIDAFICLMIDETGYLEIADVELFATESVTLLPWARVQGEVWLSGEPAEGMRVDLLGQTWEYSIFPDLSHYSHGLTDPAGQYTFPRCVAGTQLWLVILYDTETTLGGPAHREHRLLELVPGEFLQQDFGRDTIDIVGHVVLPDADEFDWTRCRVAMWPSDNDYDAITEERRAVAHDYSGILESSGAFRIRNVQPADGVVTVWIASMGETTNYWSHVLKVPITPDMFEGKSATDPVDLGDITFDDGAE